jgi:voltage-gated potassium channel
MSVRALRLIRVFRVLKLTRYLGEAAELMKALRLSRAKITVFLVVVLTVTIINGTLMYLIEGPANGFTSIPKSIYWAIVTLTTVGYGDIAPHTPLGQFIASLIMILGYGIIAIPTGIVTSEITRLQYKPPTNTQACVSCSREGHADDASYCKYCGEKL